MNNAIPNQLNYYHDLYNQPNFIANDPISLPHAYSQQQDIEIAGFFAAILAWGQRKTIINKCQTLMQHMDNAPYDFIRNHQSSDLNAFLDFKHRTFNDTDLLYTLAFLQQHYRQYPSLETAFTRTLSAEHPDIGSALIGFHRYFFSLPQYPSRTRKHIATPERKSACKRLCMYLRWMVRRDKRGVDFGLWKNIQPAQLVCPLDVHVERVARQLGLLQRPNTDWQAALELTSQLRQLDPSDPVRFDFALFGMGIGKKTA